MEERRVRRSIPHRGNTHTLLPLRVRRLSNTISCWYCDWKISTLNEPVYLFGRRHARFLRLWFSMGTGFSLSTLIIVTVILIWEAASSFHLHNGMGNTKLHNIFSTFLFGFSPLSRVSGLTMSLADGAYLCISSLIAVSVHELGHALSAASDGLQMEYIAIFIAILFPGALVALNYDLLELLPRAAALRIYSAGIWHNAVCCAACILSLALLPLILSPLYVHGENPMVLDVSSVSPLSDYLSPGDIIISLDGVPLHDVEEWVQMTANIHQQALNWSSHFKDLDDLLGVDRRKGYCVPRLTLEESIKVPSADSPAVCPEDLTAFLTISSSDSSILENDSGNHNNQRKGQTWHCLAAKDIVKLNKCGNGWMRSGTNRSNHICSEDEYCSTPVLVPGWAWIEITYTSPYSSDCMQLQKNEFPGGDTVDLGETCGGTFVFIGDLISMAQSVRLTAYRPRWTSFGVYIPHALEKIFRITSQVSLTLALLNSLPVYFLDGEAILEESLSYFNMRNKIRRKLLKGCLFGGTLISVVAFLRVFSEILRAGK